MRELAYKLLSLTSDRLFIKIKYYIRFNKIPNLDKPKTFNEKMQWLKLNNRKPEYTNMVDKYKARDYVADKIGEQYLIPLVGVWELPDDIDFKSLPNQYVIKCNHNSGTGMYICKDNFKTDEEKIKSGLRQGLKEDYFIYSREWPYKNVKKRIMCEEYISDDNNEFLTDYKFYCFDGKVKVLGIFQGRGSSSGTVGDFFDVDFNWIDMKWGYPNAPEIPKKPDKFNEMVKIAETLSKDIPHVRVDLYLSNGQIYFGELTFFDGGGFSKIIPEEWDIKLGSWINLPDKTH